VIRRLIQRWDDATPSGGEGWKRLDFAIGWAINVLTLWLVRRARRRAGVDEPQRLVRWETHLDPRTEHLARPFKMHSGPFSYSQDPYPMTELARDAESLLGTMRDEPADD